MHHHALFASPQTEEQSRTDQTAGQEGFYTLFESNEAGPLIKSQHVKCKFLYGDVVLD